MRPMLEEFLATIGLHVAGKPIDFRRVLEPFSRWLDDQVVSEEDRFYLASRLAAFICLYLVEVASGKVGVESGRITLRVPLQKDIVRAFDPYGVAFGMAQELAIPSPQRKGLSLQAYLEALSSG